MLVECDVVGADVRTAVAAERDDGDGGDAAAERGDAAAPGVVGDDGGVAVVDDGGGEQEVVDKSYIEKKCLSWARRCSRAPTYLLG